MPTITAVDVVDVRFPTSVTLDGSDAMNPDGDYSAAYVILRTSHPDLTGHGLTFTIGRGTDLCVQAGRHIAQGDRRPRRQAAYCRTARVPTSS